MPYVARTADQRFRLVIRFLFGHTYFEKRNGGYRITIDCPMTADRVSQTLKQYLFQNEYYQLEITSVVGGGNQFTIKYNDVSTDQEWCLKE